MNNLCQKVDIQEKMHEKLDQMVDILPTLSQEILDLKKRMPLQLSTPKNVEEKKASNSKVSSKRAVEVEKPTYQPPAKRQATNERRAALNALAEKHKNKK